MPDFTITLSTEAVRRLRAAIGKQNERDGTSLTVGQWLEQFIKEAAIREELGTLSSAIVDEEMDRDEIMASRIEAERQRLLEKIA